MNPDEGAHNNPYLVRDNIKEVILKDIEYLLSLETDEMLSLRYDKLEILVIFMIKPRLDLGF